MRDVERDAFSKAEVQRRLGVSAVTVHRLIKEGKLNTVRAGRRVLVPRASLERFLEPKAA